jgi:hypothetical protein
MVLRGRFRRLAGIDGFSFSRRPDTRDICDEVTSAGSFISQLYLVPVLQQIFDREGSSE